jgi:hypothetical protein
MTDEELIEQYLANGGTITKHGPKEAEVVEPTKLLPTGPAKQYDSWGKRIFNNLNRYTTIDQDPSTFNYGE